MGNISKNLKLFINQELPISIWLIISSNYIGTCNTAIIQCFCFHRRCYFSSLNQSCRFLSVRNCKEKSCCFQKSCQYFPLLQQLHTCMLFWILPRTKGTWFRKWVKLSEKTSVWACQPKQKICDTVNHCIGLDTVVISSALNTCRSK